MCKQHGAEISPLKGFLSRVDHHVISERVLLPQHLATDVAGVFLLQEYLVLVCHVAVLCRLPSVPGTDGAQPLFMGDLLELCNWRQQLFKSFLASPDNVTKNEGSKLGSKQSVFSPIQFLQEITAS